MSHHEIAEKIIQLNQSMSTEPEKVKLTQFAHGAGCGCKISPSDLSTMLQGIRKSHAGNLLVGNARK
jgi:selenophosphate synthase